MSDVMLEGYETPEAFRKDILQLLVRDAHTIYAYWELSDRKKHLALQHFQCEWHQLPKVLRVADVTYVTYNGHNANRIIDFELTPEADNWYISGLNAGAVYAAELGVYTWERQFVPFMRSDAVQTPRDRAARWGEPIVHVIPEASCSHPAHYIPPRSLENFMPYRQS